MKSSGGTLGLVIVWALLAAAGLAKNPRVGVYYNPIRGLGGEYEAGGTEGIIAALEENGFEDRMQVIKNFDPSTLKDIDVVVVSCVQAYPPPLDANNVRQGQRQFVEQGGGIVLVHESIGWRRALWDNPPFPEIGKGHGGRMVGPITLTPVQVVDKTHPVAQGLPPEIPVAYDMAQMELGPQGKMVLKVRDNATIRGNPVTLTNMPALICGKLGKGRVVLIAPLIGMQGKNLEKSPTGGELKLFLNSINWAANIKP